MGPSRPGGISIAPSTTACSSTAEAPRFEKDSINNEQSPEVHAAINEGAVVDGATEARNDIMGAFFKTLVIALPFAVAFKLLLARAV